MLNKTYKEVLEATETLENALSKWDKINDGRFIKTNDYSSYLYFMREHFKHIEEKGIFRNKKANSKYPEKLFIYSITEIFIYDKSFRTEGPLLYSSTDIKNIILPLLNFTGGFPYPVMLPRYVKNAVDEKLDMSVRMSSTL